MLKLKEITNPFESLHDTIVFDSRDWGKSEKDAWIYGIIIGWNSDNKEEVEGIFQEFNRKFKWDRDTWNRLQTLHNEYLKYKEMSKNKVIIVFNR